MEGDSDTFVSVQWLIQCVFPPLHSLLPSPSLFPTPIPPHPPLFPCPPCPPNPFFAPYFPFPSSLLPSPSSLLTPLPPLPPHPLHFLNPTVPSDSPLDSVSPSRYVLLTYFAEWSPQSPPFLHVLPIPSPHFLPLPLPFPLRSLRIGCPHPDRNSPKGRTRCFIGPCTHVEFLLLLPAPYTLSHLSARSTFTYH